MTPDTLNDNQDSARSRFPFDHLSQAEIIEFEKLLPLALKRYLGLSPTLRTKAAQRFNELPARRYSPPAPPHTPPEAA